MSKCGYLVVAALLVGVGCSTSSEPLPTGDLVKQVRAANTAQDIPKATALVETAREAHGTTPTVLLAQSWVARGALAQAELDTAERVARRTYEEVQGLLASRALDADEDLPLALGASIEVLANVAVERGARSEALAYLEEQHARYAETSMAKRLQKNINLLSLEGTPAPPLTADEYLGEPPPALDTLEGRAVLLFFWAHWCSDCKAQGPVLARLVERYGDQGLTVLAPTQRFGYVAAGKDAPPAEEARYIADIWRTHYAGLAGTPVHLDEGNHRRYGVSTTPTLVLVDKAGLIRMYHPGQMTEDELEPLVRALVNPAAPSS